MTPDRLPATPGLVVYESRCCHGSCYMLCSKTFLVVLVVAAVELTAPSVSSTRTNLSSRPSPIDARSGNSVT